MGTEVGSLNLNVVMIWSSCLELSRGCQGDKNSDKYTLKLTLMVFYFPQDDKNPDWYSNSYSACDTHYQM